MKNSRELISTYLGVPFKHMGRDLQGLDCWGLVVHAYMAELGVAVLDLGDYERKWADKGGNYFVEKYYGEWSLVRAADARIYDVVLFKNPKGVPYHAGLMLNFGEFLQCAGKVGVVKTKLDRAWKDKIYGVYRHNG